MSFYCKPRAYPLQNAQLILPFIKHLPSVTWSQFGNYHFKKFLYPKFYDIRSKKEISIAYKDENLYNFDFNIFKHLQKMNKQTSAGFSYRYPYKNQNITAILNLLYRIRQGTVYSVMKCAQKGEILPKEKYLERSKTRLFTVNDGHVELLLRIVFQKAIDVLLKNRVRPFKIGFSVFHQGISEYFDYSGVDDMVSLDGSSFDSSLSLWIMVAAIQKMCSDAGYTKYEIAMAIIIFIEFICQPRIYQRYVFSLFGSLPSGCLLTAILNCYVVEIITSNMYPSSEKIFFYGSHGDDVFIKKDHVDIFCMLSQQYGLDYQGTEALVFLSFTPVKVDNGWIAKYKDFDKCWSKIAYFKPYQNLKIVYSFFYSLYICYFYHFYYDKSKEFNNNLFFSITKKLAPGFFSKEFLISKALEIWFYDTH